MLLWVFGKCMLTMKPLALVVSWDNQMHNRCHAYLSSLDTGIETIQTDMSQSAYNAFCH